MYVSKCIQSIQKSPVLVTAVNGKVVEKKGGTIKKYKLYAKVLY